MSIVEINWRPSDRQLRQFGVIACLALPLIGWLWSGGTLAVVGWCAVAGGVLGGVGLWRPRYLKPVFVVLTLVVLPIGMLLGEVALLVIYFGVFLPIGLIFRLIRRDALQLTFQPTAKTYWQAKKPPTGRPAITDNSERRYTGDDTQTLQTNCSRSRQDFGCA